MNFYRVKFFLSLAFILSQAKILAQSSYVPFPEGQAVWHVIHINWAYILPEHWQYMYDGDTTFNGFAYHKISYKYEYVNLGNGNLQYDDNGIVGYLRQDSLAKKVYYIQRDFPDQENLLYDFDLQVGDSVPPTYLQSIPDLRVLAKDSVLVGSSYRSKFILSSDSINYIEMIEGIGYIGGLLFAQVMNNCFETCLRLACFQQDGQTLFSPDVWNGYFQYPFGFCHIVGLNEINPHNQTFSIQPNLVSSGESFAITNPDVSDIDVSVLDIFGNVILRKRFIHHPQIEISSIQFSKGIYLVKILADDKFLSTQKLVVQ